LEIAQRMRKIGKVKFNPKMTVKFSMRCYVKFGTLKSLYIWLYIVLKGGKSDKYSYTGKTYK
ncbi:MAG: glycosyltransferase family 2 protein, partial [Methanomicrobium sp.]|nr:glycosyltransferase family 2 protein [Methanomicrobium sp.]